MTEAVCLAHERESDQARNSWLVLQELTVDFHVSNVGVTSSSGSADAHSPFETTSFNAGWVGWRLSSELTVLDTRLALTGPPPKCVMLGRPRDGPQQASSAKA